MKLTQAQLEILANGRIEDNRFYLPGQLDRKQYLNINEVLNSIGLIWNKGKKAHIVEDLTQEQLEEAIEDIIETGECETIKETIKKFQFYPTPPEVAEYLVELAEINHRDSILEPSAGLGNIANEICNYEYKDLTLIELDEQKCYELVDRQYKTINEDFLKFNENHPEFDTTFDKIIANPPFSKSQDVKHILHMYELLKEGGRLVSIASSSIKTREGKLYDELRTLNPEFIELPEGSFKTSGTLVNTLIVVINK